MLDPGSLYRMQGLRVAKPLDCRDLAVEIADRQLAGTDRDAIDMHMNRYFGPNCPDLTALSDADRAGIQQGQVFQGMSKQGVILAIGYPPEHATPSLDSDQWSYWRNSHSRFLVYFVDGVVSGIQN